MKISAKGRYALAAAICLARQYDAGGYSTLSSISDALGVSKIYLEQVFALLKRGALVASAKGAQGGYRLAQPPEQINALQLLRAVELSLFEPAGSAVADKAPDIEAALIDCVFGALDAAVAATLEQVTLADLTARAERQRRQDTLMFYI